MGAIVARVSGGDHLYIFSDDILDALSAYPEQEDIDVGIRNASAVFLAGSYLEAYINEQIAIHAEIAPKFRPDEAQLWSALESMQDSTSWRDKWAFITAFTKGVTWDGGRDPFQSYDTLISLRNELVHFKGRWSGDNQPPVKRIKSLVDTLGVEPTIMESAMSVSSWVSSLLRSPKLITWIRDAVFALEEPIEEFLLGRVPEGDMIKLKHSRRLRWGMPTKRYPLS
jgi:hypothetical protein